MYVVCLELLAESLELDFYSLAVCLGMICAVVAMLEHRLHGSNEKYQEYSDEFSFVVSPELGYFPTTPGVYIHSICRIHSVKSSPWLMTNDHIYTTSPTMLKSPM